MKTISIIKAKIISLTPLFIGNDDETVLIYEDENLAFIPATSIAGSFRAFLDSIGQNTSDLFGDSELNTQSKIYIKDATAKIKGFTKRDNLKINPESGSNVTGSKRENTYLDRGLEFELIFEIKDYLSQDETLIFKALKALDESIIRFGGNKSSGLGVFKVVEVTQIKFNLKNKEDLLSYLKQDYSKEENVTEKLNEIVIENGFVFFNLEGKFTTPLIIKSNNILDLDKPDSTSIMDSYNDYIIPGSSLKGAFRSRIECIANYYSLDNELGELFGEFNGSEKGEFKLSRIFANESTLTNEQNKVYFKNRIDRFTSGTINNALMQDEPVTAEAVISLIYRKTSNISYDNMVIGLISLALRDLATENLNLGGDFSIGRGRFKATKMSIKDGQKNIEIDFKNKSISNKNCLDEYISAIKNYNVRR